MERLEVVLTQSTNGRPRTALDGPQETITPEDTLREAGVSSRRQARYQRRLSSLLAGSRGDVVITADRAQLSVAFHQVADGLVELVATGVVE